MKQILSLLFDAITYDGNVTLTIINWFLLIMVLIPFLEKEIKIETRKWYIVFLISFLLQTVFWFVLNARGISIVWNAMFGFLMIVLVKSKETISNKSIWWLIFPIGMSIIADVYFGITFPLITTVAHCSAIVLGMLLYFLIRLIPVRNH